MADNTLPPGVSAELVTKIQATAEADPGFREAFLTDPKAAYQERFGEELLPGETIEVRSFENGGRAIALPRHNYAWLIPNADGELSDELLEMAGGVGTSPNAGMPGGKTGNSPPPPAPT